MARSLIGVGDAATSVRLRLSVPPFGANADARTGEPWQRCYSVHSGMPPLQPSSLYTGFKRHLPEPLFYVVPAMMWLALALRYGSLTLPTAANPRMETGGLWGESKAQGLRLFGPLARRFMARTIGVEIAREGTTAEPSGRTITRSGLSFPVIAKPDRGYQGWGVRTVFDDNDLAGYMASMQAGSTVLLQERVPFAGEAGIFYVRYPGEAHGRIYSMTLVYSPHVAGDGHKTLAELVDCDAVLSKSRAVFEKSHRASWDAIIPNGDVIVLADSRSARLGAVYRDAREHVTRALEQCIDAISWDIDGFYFGRFDIRFASLDRLKKGEGFSIVELNGAGGEILRIWDGRTRLVDAYRGLWQQYRTLFAIAAENRKRGCRPTSLIDMIRFVRSQETLRRSYPASG